MPNCVICGKETNDYNKFDQGEPWPCHDTPCYEDYQIEHGDENGA